MSSPVIPPMRTIVVEEQQPMFGVGRRPVVVEELVPVIVIISSQIMVSVSQLEYISYDH